MAAIDPPVLLDSHVMLVAEKQIFRRHNASRKEMSPHPVSMAFGLESVSQVSMAKYVHEQLTTWDEPIRNPRQQVLVIANVLEHLNRNNSIESILCIKRTDIGRSHAYVLEPSFGTLRLNECLLAHGI
jgi:glycyl-tRNA synthetase (class II)